MAVLLILVNFCGQGEQASFSLLGLPASLGKKNTYHVGRCLLMTLLFKSMATTLDYMASLSHRSSKSLLMLKLDVFETNVRLFLKTT
jgi:hypothetical protein